MGTADRGTDSTLGGAMKAANYWDVSGTENLQHPYWVMQTWIHDCRAGMAAIAIPDLGDHTLVRRRCITMR